MNKPTAKKEAPKKKRAKRRTPEQIAADKIKKERAKAKAKAVKETAKRAKERERLSKLTIKSIADKSIDKLKIARAAKALDDIKRNGYINERDAAIGRSTYNQLKKRIEDSKGGVIKHNTFIMYLSNIKSYVSDHDITNPVAERRLELWLEKYPEHVDSFSNWDGMSWREKRSVLSRVIEEIKLERRKLVDLKEQNAFSKKRNELKAITKDLRSSFFKSLMIEEDDFQQHKQRSIDLIESYQRKENALYFNPVNVANFALGALSNSCIATVYIPNNTKAESVTDLRSNSKAQNGWQALAIAIGVFTGRRMSEICYLSTFEKVGKYKLKISNLAKKVHGDQSSVVIDTWIQADHIVKRLKDLREHIEKLGLLDGIDKQSTRFETLTEFNNRFSWRLNDAAKHIMSTWFYDENGEMLISKNLQKNSFSKFKNTRDIFIKTAHAIHELQGGKMSLNLFAQENLGHEHLTTSFSYDKFIITKKPTLDEVKALKKIKLHVSDNSEERVKKLKQLYKDEHFESLAHIRCLQWSIEQLEEDPYITINTTLLQKHKVASQRYIGTFVAEMKKLGYTNAR